MGMPISSVSSGIGFAPVPEPIRMQARIAQRQAAVEQFTATLPGNDGQTDYTSQNLHQVTADIEHVSLTFNKKLQFVVDQRSQEVIVKVIDKETDKVIKVLPPEELQRLHRKLRETIGFLFNERV
jgi:flagellar protein FlaG